MAQKEIRSKWFLLIPIIAVIYTAWAILLALGKTFGYVIQVFGFSFQQWLYVGSAVFIVLIVIMILWMAPPKKEELLAEEEKAEQEAVLPVVIEAEPYPEAASEPVVEPAPAEEKVVSYPKEIEGAVYVDIMIEIEKNTILNLRTFLGRNCMLCPEQNGCWEKYKSAVTREEFDTSIDCFKAKTKSVGA